MGLPFYKPTPAKTGSLCSFEVRAVTDSFDPKTARVTKKGDKAVYVEFCSQTGWDAAKKEGSFKGGKKARVKFSPTEISELILSLRTLQPAFPPPSWKKDAKHGAYHSSPNGSTTINMEPYEDGMSLRIYQKPKDGEGSSFRMGFTKAECVLLGLFLQDALTRIFAACYSEDKKKRDILFKNRDVSEKKPAKKPLKDGAPTPADTLTNDSNVPADVLL